MKYKSMFWKIVINVCEFFNWKVILFIYCNFMDIFKKVFYLFYWFLDCFIKNCMLYMNIVCYRVMFL